MKFGTLLLQLGYARPEHIIAVTELQKLGDKRSLGEILIEDLGYCPASIFHAKCLHNKLMQSGNEIDALFSPAPQLPNDDKPTESDIMKWLTEGDGA